MPKQHSRNPLQIVWEEAKEKWPFLAKGWPRASIALLLLGIGAFASGAIQKIPDLLWPSRPTISAPSHPDIPPPLKAPPAELEVVSVKLGPTSRDYEWGGQRVPQSEIGSIKGDYIFPTLSDKISKYCAHPSRAYLRKYLSYWDRYASYLMPNEKPHPDGTLGEYERFRTDHTKRIASDFGLNPSEITPTGRPGSPVASLDGAPTARPVLDISLHNNTAQPVLLTSASLEERAAEGIPAIGGGDVYTASGLPVSGALSFSLGDNGVKDLQFSDPIILPPHGYARILISIGGGEKTYVEQDGHMVEADASLTMFLGRVVFSYDRGGRVVTDPICLRFLVDDGSTDDGSVDGG